MTATYSNAVLVAILPHVSDCAKSLDLPMSNPITTSEVDHFAPPVYKEVAYGAVWLTNHDWFSFTEGCVDGFRTPDNWFTQQDFDLETVKRFIGKDNMTTNEVIEFARNAFVKLGYKLADFHLDAAPTRIQGPSDLKNIGHIPYCRVAWESPKSDTDTDTDEVRLKSYEVRFEIDMQRKQIVGMSLIGRAFWRSAPKIDVVSELESDYRKRIQGKMFVRTNAPASRPMNGD